MEFCIFSAMYDISEAVKEDVMDCKSISIYRRWKAKYEEFKLANGFQEDTIGTFMEFMTFLGKRYKVTTMWQAASCVNKYMRVGKNVDFISSAVFKSFMKKMEKKHTVKKSATLSCEEINRYLVESPQDARTLQVPFC